MKKLFTTLVCIGYLIFPLFLHSQVSREIYHSVIEVYTDSSIEEGDTLQVLGYYTNTEYNLLLDYYGDFDKDQVYAVHSILTLTGILPPDTAWDGGFIVAKGTITFEEIPFPYHEEDSLMAILNAFEITVLIPADEEEPAPEKYKYQKKKETGENGTGNRETCDSCKFAFLLSGGVDTLNNHAKYWENLAALYNFKVDSLGYCASNVFVHYFKGDPRDGRIPADRVIRADSTKIDSTFQVISSRVAECNRNGTPATFQKMVSNHGDEGGGINLLGDDLLMPEHLKEQQQKVIDSCCRTVYDEFIQCYGGHSVDAMSTLDTKNKATIYVNSNADKATGHSPHDKVHPYLESKIESLDTGKSYEDAVVNGKLAYDDYLRGTIARIHNRLMVLRGDPTIPNREEEIAKCLADSTERAGKICTSRNVTIVPFTHYCQWKRFVVPPGGQLVVNFSGNSNSCGNATVYKENPVTGERTKVKVWNWNHPGSYGYMAGNEQRAVDGELTGSTIFWIHNDNDTSRLRVESLGTPVLDESPSNASLYPGFSFGGNDGSSSEFIPVPVPGYFVESIDQPNISLHSLPAILGPGYVQQFGFSFQIDPLNELWSNMELIINVNNVTNPNALMVQSPSGSIPMATVQINQPGTYIIPLGDFTLNGTYGQISLMPLNGLQIGLDAWGFRSVFDFNAPQSSVWVGNVSNNWTDPANWSDGVPGINEIVTIMPGIFQPVIVTDVFIKSITISAGATVISASGGSLTVRGN